ncbi:MAG TPA: radical SAM protein [Candidatus Polarisedimenticolaceae bacterium]|nr:radical SAM protein [Candidatus Polarisedimenticolaceae bacterium]
MQPHLRERTPEEIARDLAISLPAARRLCVKALWEDAEDLGDRLEVVDRQRAQDGFVKYLFRGADGVPFEAVRIPLHRPRWSVCVSSQAGCAMGCAFCATARLLRRRNLEAWEMLEQVLTVRREGRERPVTSVVFQGQGEPLHNLGAVLRAAERLRCPTGLRIRGENITLSTVGLLPELRELAALDLPYRLVLSLHSAFSEKRAALVPTGRRFAVPDLLEPLLARARSRREPVHLAWVLIAGFNTGEEEAAELGRLLGGTPVRLSLVDVRDESGRFAAPEEAERNAFLDALRRNGLAFVRRYSGGADIRAACGTLSSNSATTGR